MGRVKIAPLGPPWDIFVLGSLKIGSFPAPSLPHSMGTLAFVFEKQRLSGGEGSPHLTPRMLALTSLPTEPS